jgi:flagellar basal-body rod protein FlgG
MSAGSTNISTIATIQLADFINPTGLQPIGDNLYIETPASGSPVVGNPGQNGIGTIKSKALESSNVNVVNELVALIEGQRAYEMNAKAVETINNEEQFIIQVL